MAKAYSIASTRWLLRDEHLRFSGLAPFEVARDPELQHHEVAYDEAVPLPTAEDRLIDTFDFTEAEAICRLYRYEGGYRFTMERTEGKIVAFEIPHEGLIRCNYRAEMNASLFRFGLWMTFNLRASAEQTMAIHASTLVYRGEAVLCLGESGTGKSTHTRLWREHVEGAELLNDDSPILRIEEGEAIVYGSPWSGKTPCYRTEHYPVRGFLRLEQAPQNTIRKLGTLEAYAALQPSLPPSFMHDELLIDRLHRLLSALLREDRVYRLQCRPDREAAQLARQTLYT